MKSPLSRAALIAGAALSVTFAGATFAQTHPAPAGAPPAAHQKRQHDPAEHAKRLRDALQLTPAQEPALQALIASHAEHRADRKERKADRQAMRNLTTPQRLDAMAAHMAERQQAFAAHAAAVKRFYAQLTPTQQKAFDAMHPKMGKGGHGGGHHGMGGDDHGGRGRGGDHG